MKGYNSEAARWDPQRARCRGSGQSLVSSEFPPSLNHCHLFNNLETPEPLFEGVYGGFMAYAWLKSWPLMTELKLQSPPLPGDDG